MTTEELIGRVAIKYLSERLEAEDGSDGTARYLLDCLTAKQTSAVASAILNDSSLITRVDIKLPRKFLSEFSLPEHILTDKRATYYRNADCEKDALLLATNGDDEQQSLKDMTPIGSMQLLGHPSLWTSCINVDIGLSEDHLKWWSQALKGLLEVQFYDLDIFSSYIIETHRQLKEEGEPLLEALGLALPALRIPSDKTFFNVLNAKNAGHLSRWKNLFNKAIRQRSCYLKKYTPSQSLLSKDQLSETFEKVKYDIPIEDHTAIKQFIDADSGWNNFAAALSCCEWENINPLFDGLKKEKFNLGRKTIEFYDEREPTLLNEDEQDYLSNLAKSRTTSSADSSDEEFYENHRLELKEDSFLKTKWDQFIFGKPVESEDLLVGLTQCLEGLFSHSEAIVSAKLTITSDRRTKLDLKKLNFEAGEYFSFRYKGLPERLGNGIIWDTGELFEFQNHLSAWRQEKKTKLNRSKAKAALRIKFFINLRVTHLNGSETNPTKQLIWTFNPNAVAAEQPGDWGRLNSNPLSRCLASRETISGKGNVQSIDLRDSNTLHASYAQDRGSFVPAYHKKHDLGLIWNDNLDSAVSQNLVDERVANELRVSWDNFESLYTQSITEYYKHGFLAEGIHEQGEAFSRLLELIREKAFGDRNRELLLHPLLDIGTAQISGDKVTAIITPWNPMRLVAMDVKLKQLARLLSELLSCEEHHFSDPRLFFKELTEGLQHPYYPELAIGWDGREAKLLAVTDHNLDYSLHENPLAENDGLDETNESPQRTALLVHDLIKKYLKLYPHERANLSTVLFNCDCSRLPTALVDKVSELHEDDDDMRCEVILRHRDKGTLINLYERIIESSDDDIDSFVASEATTDFMARLRIGIMAHQAPTPDPKDGRPTDIVFLQDVISRHAEVEWYNNESEPVDPLELIPSQWSRRKPSSKDEMKSVVYLACPMQTEAGWSYINALSSIIKPHLKDFGKHLLPARQLDFNDSRTAEIFDEIHQLGNWVANYDELLDRRQLMNQEVRVIRYKQTSNQGRNLLISSRAPLGLLKSMVKGRIASLNLGIEENALGVLVERFIDDANQASGDLVLRAAKRGRNASELMGVVLSKYLIEDELGPSSLHGWYFLDDYAEWLGQKEEQIADLMALCPVIEGGAYKLGIIVSESKYIDQASLSSKCKESQKQLRDTVKRMREALFNEPACMDRSLWLSRLSNLVMSGVHVPSGSMIDLAKWRDALRNGQCEVFIRGYSHVFVSGPSDSGECSDFAVVADLEDAYQEVFSRAKLRELLAAYMAKESVISIRKDNSDQNVWEVPSWRSITPEAKDVETKTTPPAETTKTPEPVKPNNGIIGKKESENKEKPPEAESSDHFSDLVSKLEAKFPVNDQNKKDAEDWLHKTANGCKSALQQYQLKAKLISSRLTPNCALLKFEGSGNLTVNDVKKRQEEFLTSHGLNITSVKAEAGVVSISIARDKREALHLSKVWKQWDIDRSSFNSRLLIGIKEEDGSPLFFSPQENAPHTLIAGGTGSGKSVLIQNIILGIAATNTPKNASIVLIDPKRVDFNKFKKLPHVGNTIIKQKADAVEKLKSLVEEMERRYEIFEEYEVSNVTELKKKFSEVEMPLIWVIHDELALWMLDSDYSTQITQAVNQLAVAARAAGIFLIFGAQRPDNTVIPMQLRSNLGNRLVLKVDGEGTSDIALSEKGAEKLLGKGHMLAKLEGEYNTIFAQVPFAGDEHLDFLVSEIAACSQNLETAH